MISIPLSLSIGIVLLNVLGYTINQLTIVGLVVALGLLVDDSIVVQWKTSSVGMREGHSRLEARHSREPSKSVWRWLAAATLMIAFMPLVFLPSVSGDFIRSLPMGVIVTVLASMLVSLTVIPFLSSLLLKKHEDHSEGNVFFRAVKEHYPQDICTISGSRFKSSNGGSNISGGTFRWFLGVVSRDWVQPLSRVREAAILC